MSLFENCTTHYSAEKDFLNCTNTTRQCDLMVSMHNIQLVLTILDLYIPTVLFIIGALLNIHCLSLTFPVFLRLGEVSRKRYVFLLSRCISSTCAAISMLLLRCVISVFSFPAISNYYIFFFLIFFNTTSFYSLLGSYIGNAIMLYVGVNHPVYYSNKLELIHVYWIACGNVFISGIISFTSAFFQAGTISPNGPINCTTSSCVNTLSWCSFAIISCAFSVTILILSFVLISMCLNNRRNRKNGHFSKSSIVQQAQKRIASALFIIFLISMSEAIFSSFLNNLDVDPVLNTCRNFYQADHLILASVFTSFATIIWAIVVIIDPVSNIIFDQNMTEQIEKQMKWMKWKYVETVTSMSRKKTRL